MKKTLRMMVRVMAGVAAGVVAVGAWAQQRAATPDPGRIEYLTSCASCHGVNARGDGPMKAYLTKAPSDLTTLARRNGGALPVQLVWETIDGRAEVGPHGSREMPVWGNEYRARAQRMVDEQEFPEWYVRGRIVALVDYLQRVQAR